MINDNKSHSFNLLEFQAFTPSDFDSIEFISRKQITQIIDEELLRLYLLEIDLAIHDDFLEDRKRTKTKHTSCKKEKGEIKEFKVDETELKAVKKEMFDNPIELLKWIENN